MIPIQIKNITRGMQLSEIQQIESTFHQAFDRFSNFIREARLTLRDTNGPKGGVDKLCTIQLNFYPRGLAVVKSSGTSFSHAANIACDKMQQVAGRRLSKKNNRKKSIPLKISQIGVEGELAYGN